MQLKALFFSCITLNGKYIKVSLLVPLNLTSSRVQSY